MNPLTKPELPPAKMSIEAFFDWSETQERRYELVEGVACMLPWVKRSHSLIASNIAHALQMQINRAAYAIHQGDFAVPAGADSIRFADVLVEPRGGPLDGRTADTALVLVEILSPSTRRVAFGAKTSEYLGLSSLASYLIVDQDRRSAWLWNRAEAGAWPKEAVHITNRDAEVSIPAIGCTLRFDDIYGDVC